MSGCCLGAALSWFAWCAACGGWLFSIDPSFRTVTLIILGLGFLRARLLRLYFTAVFPPIFLQLRKGPLWRCAELLQSYVLCSSDQCRTVTLRLPAAANYSGVCWEEGIGGGGVTMTSLHWRCEMWFDCVELKRSAKLSSSATAPCTFTTAPSFQACLRAFICTFCMCVCIYVYACMCADMYICIYMHVCMHLYI